MPKPLLSPAELADELGIPLSTIYQWNSRGTGPRYVVCGRHVRYRRADIDSWLESNASTSPVAIGGV